MIKATTALYFASGLLLLVGFVLIGVGWHFNISNTQVFGGFYVTLGTVLLVWTKYLDGRSRTTTSK
jgi:hypothetical protein